MFGKLKSVFSRFSKKASEGKPKPKKVAEKPEEKPKKKGFLSKFRKPKDEKPKKGFFVKISEQKVEKLLGELEENLLENNVAFDVVEKICSELKAALLVKKTKDLKKELERILTELLSQEQPDLMKLSSQKPLVIMFVGVNGVGKTTTIAKLTNWFQKQKKSVVLAAADTFRAAAIEQLQSHADKLKVKMIKHKYGADPAAVAFDARKHAEAKSIDIVIIDTAGRQHASEDLMAELAKIKRVVKPDITILSVDSLTGNDAAEQAKYFSEKIGINGIIISKVDADERGGAVISAAWVAQKPILFIGTGQQYTDFELFDYKKIIGKIL